MAISNLVRVKDNLQSMIDQGAPEADIDGYLKSEGYTPSSFRTALGKFQKQVDAVGYGVGSEMLSGLTFGFGDELRSRITGEPIEAVRAGQEAYRKANPVASTVANVVGSLPTAIIPGAGAANVLRGVGMAGKAARAVGTLATGAGYGAASGAGESTEGSRGQGATQGALFGAAVAPVGAIIGRGAQAVGQRRAGNLPPDLRAQAIALGGIKSSNLTPQQVIEQMVSGKTIAEVSKPLTDLAGAVVRRSPEAAARAAELTATRKVSRPQDLIDAVRGEVAGGEATTAAQIQKITEAQRKAATPFYQQAFNEAGPIQSQLIDDLMTLEPFQMAYKRAQSIAKLERNPIPDYQPGQPISLRAANYIKQGLDEVVYGAKRDPSSSIGKTQLGLIDQLRGDFVREVDSMAPESYRTARGIYAGAARDQEAADAGSQAWKNGPEYVANFLQNASESEANAFRAAASAEFQRLQSRLRNTTESFRLLDTPNNQAVVQQLSAVTGPSKVPFIVGQQRNQAEFANALTGGSQSTPRLAADALLAESESIPSQVVREGPIRTAINASMQKIADYAQTGGSKTVSNLSEILLNPDTALENLRKLGILEDQLRRQAGIRAGAYSSGAATTGGVFGGSQQ